MVKRQEDLLDEYRMANKYLLDAARRLSGGKLVLPPVKAMQRAARFQGLIRQKFGDTNQARKLACDVLGISGRQFTKLAAGGDLTDGFIGCLEDLPDYVPPSRGKAKRRQKSAVTKRHQEIERLMADVPKPKKHSRLKSDMTKDELTRIGELAFGANWLAELATMIEYSEWNLKQCLGGSDNRWISQATGEYLRVLDYRIRHRGKSWSPSLPRES